MPRYARRRKDYEDYGLVLWEGRVYGVPEDDNSNRRLVSLVTPEKILRQSGAPEEQARPAIRVPLRQLQLAEPVSADPQAIRSFFRLEAMPWELMENGRYPFSEETGKIEITEEDLLCLTGRLPLFRNGFIRRNWHRTFMNEDDPSCPKHILLPEADRPGFSFRFFAEKFFQLLERIDPEEGDWRYVFFLRDCYLESKGKPLAETVLPDEYRRDMARSLIRYVRNHPVTKEIREYYVRLLEQCLESGHYTGILEYAFAYYWGNELVPCDGRKAEHAFLWLYDPDRNPDDGLCWAAAPLGCLYAGTCLGEPDYRKAFLCFSFAAKHGMTEAACRLSDLYRTGRGTESDPEKAFGLVNSLYSRADRRNTADGEYAQICLRMGYCYRDGAGMTPDREKALDFFRKAERALEARKRRDPAYRDDGLEEEIRAATESVKKRRTGTDRKKTK